jgi:hypothetical protein
MTDPARSDFIGHWCSGRGFDIAQFSNGVDRSSVRVDEGHAGWAAVDVEVDQLPRVAGQAAVKIIAEQVGDPSALDLGWSPGALDGLTTHANVLQAACRCIRLAGRSLSV